MGIKFNPLIFSGLDFTGSGGSSTPMAIGGPITGSTSQSVLFVGAGGILSQDNPNFIYNSVSHQLTVVGSILTPSIDSTGSTLTIAPTATIINIGNVGATVNIQGTTLYENVTTLNVSNPVINLNVGAGIGSGANSGILVQENNVVTGYAETSADRNSWSFKAPNTAGVVTLTPGAGGFTIDQGSHNPVTIGTANGLSLSTQALSLQAADATHTGALTSTDWNTFNNGVVGAANKSLSNLTATSINQDLVPNADATLRLGSATNKYLAAYINFIIDAGGNLVLNSVGRTLANQSGTTLIDFNNSNLNFQTKVLQNVADPVLASDVATKNYVDSQITTAAGANKALSNLTTTAINLSLNPASASSISLGNTNNWFELFTKQVGFYDSNNIYGVIQSNITGTFGGISVSRAMTFNSRSDFTSLPMDMVISSDNTGFSGNVVVTSGSAASGLNSGNTTISTGFGGVTTSNTGTLNLFTGDAQGANNSGNIVIKTGASPSGTRGTITLNGSAISANSTKISNVTDPTSAQDAATKNYVDTQIVGASGANTSLSNLITTSVNQSLIPAANLTQNLGSAAKAWNDSYLGTLKDGAGFASISVPNRYLANSNGTPVFTFASTGVIAATAGIGFGLNGATSGQITQKAADITTDYTVKWPSSQGGSGTILTNDGSGNLSWGTTGGSTGDLAQTSFSAVDNQATPANVTGFAFANASVRAFDALVSITRGSTYTSMKLLGIQKGASWDLNQSSVGDVTGITLSITTAGQIQYTSTSTGAGATIKFRAIVTNV